jgi:FkbM family methyltransferase
MSRPETVSFTAAGRSLTLGFASADDHIARAIRHSGTFYEAELLADVRSRLFFAHCAVDVGAHVGNHTLYFAHMLGLKTISFEPNPTTYALLEANIRDNGLEEICRPRNAAVGAATGHVRASQPPDSNSGMATVKADPTGRVPLVRLDDDVRGEPRIDVVKIDVEGWELEVLKGGEAVIARHRPLLYVEVMEPQFAGVEKHLRTRGYQCWKRFNATPTFLFLPRERLHG